MLNIGPGELLAICVIALIVLGPEKLPQAIRTVGRVTGELRRMSNGFQSELRRAFPEEEPEPRRVYPDRSRQGTAAAHGSGADAATAAEDASGGPDDTVDTAGSTPEAAGTGDPAATITEDAPDNLDRS